jgi:hypothetical protein
VKVNDADKKLFNRAAALTGKPINFDSLNLILDQFIIDKGELAQNIETLNKSIRKIIKP